MQKNDFIRIRYIAKIKENNLEFDKNEDMPLVVGAGWVLKGLDDGILDMNVSDKKTIELTPENAIGKRNDKLVKLISVSEFKKHGQKPVPGMVFQADRMYGKVLSVSGGRVKVDFNHPLAGKTLVFNVEVLKKIEKDDEKIRAIIEWFMKPQTDADRKLLEDIKITINGKEVELDLPPLVTLNSVYKRKISDDVINFLGMERLKFLEVYEKQKEADKKKIDELNQKLQVQEVN